MTDYITIKEFAVRAGVSPQAVYKQVERKLNNYVKLVDNQKMIDIKALQEVYGIEVEQPIQASGHSQQIIDRLLFDMLQEELHKKNEQIVSLQQMIKDNELRYYETVMQAQQNLEREQQLHLLSKQRILELEDKQVDKSSDWTKLFKRWLSKD